MPPHMLFLMVGNDTSLPFSERAGVTTLVIELILQECAPASWLGDAVICHETLKELGVAYLSKQGPNKHE